MTKIYGDMETSVICDSFERCMAERVSCSKCGFYVYGRCKNEMMKAGIERMRELQEVKESLEKEVCLLKEKEADVVLCKFCLYYHDMNDGYRDCIHRYGLDYPGESDFCSYGKRRKDDEADRR